MKTRLFTILFAATLFTAGLSSCAEEDILPKDTKKKAGENLPKEKGAQGVEDGF